MTDIFFIYLWFSKEKHEEKQHYLGQPDPEEHQGISERFNNSRRVILKYLGPQLFLRIGKHMVHHNNSVLRFVCLFSKGGELQNVYGLLKNELQASNPFGCDS